MKKNQINSMNLTTQSVDNIYDAIRSQNKGVIKILNMIQNNNRLHPIFESLEKSSISNKEFFNVEVK